MLVNLFKSSQLGVFILVVVLSLVPFLCNLFALPVSGQLEFTMPFISTVFELIQRNKIVAVIFSWMFLLVNAFVVNQLSIQHQLFTKSTFIPALIYFLIQSMIVASWGFHPVIISSLFIIWAINKLFGLAKSEHNFPIIFDSAFLISIASLFYFPAAFFFLVLLVSLVSFSSVSVRGFLLACVGLVLPYFFLAVGDFTVHGRVSLEVIHSYFKIHVPLPLQNIKMPIIVTVSILLFLALVTFGQFRKTVTINKVAVWKSHFLLIWTIPVIALIVAVFKGEWKGPLLFIGIPFSIYLCNFFIFYKKEWLASTFLVALFACSVWIILAR